MLNLFGAHRFSKIRNLQQPQWATIPVSCETVGTTAVCSLYEIRHGWYGGTELSTQQAGPIHVYVQDKNLPACGSRYAELIGAECTPLDKHSHPEVSCYEYHVLYVCMYATTTYAEQPQNRFCNAKVDTGL